MKNLFNTKRADSKLLSIWWFAVLTAIAVGVVIATMIFFSAKVDVRLLEADVLASRVIGCISNEGVISQDFIEGKLNIFEKCGLNEKVLDSADYFIKVENLGQNKILLEKGNSAFEKDCLIAKSMIKADKFARCVNLDIKLKDINNKEVSLKIITGSNYEYRSEGASS